MLNSSDKFALINLLFFVDLSNFFEKKEFARNQTKYHMLSLYNYNRYVTSAFIEILLLPKMKYMTKTFFLNPQPP